VGIAEKLLLTLGLLAIVSPTCPAQNREETNQLARDIFKQLIAIDTTESAGNVTTAAEAMAKRFREAGFPENDIKIAGPIERKKNLVVRLRGTNKRKALLLLGHLDVVEARREEWSVNPFELLEKDGYFYGRGTNDMKSLDAILVANLIRFKKQGFVPDRDLILALTADEEGSDSNGVDWLLKERRDWIDAEYCINLDGGEFEIRGGKRVLVALEASEKVYVDYQFEAVNPGGHSDRPGPENAIYELAGALRRLQAFTFPLEMNEITRNYFQRTAAITPGQTGSDFLAVAEQPPDPEAVKRLSTNPHYNSMLRTTCVATMLSAGHAPNALPQTARANVNCRIFPGEEPQEVLKTLERVVSNPKVSVTIVPQRTADGKLIPEVSVPPSPLLPEIVSAMERTVATMWPGLPVVPSMSAGASDARCLRIAGMPTYDIACMFYDMDDYRAHGKDERIRVEDFYDGVEFSCRLLRDLSTPR
jgi:acetylornithine deacetylase/succinyl-diaminopimelate desuccinylase-like protein